MTTTTTTLPYLFERISEDYDMRCLHCGYEGAIDVQESPSMYVGHDTVQICPGCGSTETADPFTGKALIHLTPKAATPATLTDDQQDQALAIVAAWLGPRMGYDGPAPTGVAAAMNGAGPMLHRTWDWPTSGPTPTVLLEGGPYDWAGYVSGDEAVVAALRAIGVFAEPYAGYALCLYVA